MNVTLETLLDNSGTVARVAILGPVTTFNAYALTLTGLNYSPCLCSVLFSKNAITVASYFQPPAICHTYLRMRMYVLVDLVYVKYSIAFVSSCHDAGIHVHVADEHYDQVYLWAGCHG